MIKQRNQNENLNSTTVTWHASASGSLMLLGEHAVLHNKQAIVLAINRRINVKLQPRLDNIIHIKSKELGEFMCNIQDEIHVKPPFTFVLNSIKLMQKFLPQGFDLFIDAEFSANLGFGSSSAVTVATIAVLLAYCNNAGSLHLNFDLNSNLNVDLDYKLNTTTKQELSHKFKVKVFDLAFKVILMTQGLGSGADVSASVFGGIVAYRKHPFKAQRINIKTTQIADIMPITVIYSGYKTPTKEVVNYVYSLRKKHIKIFKKLENIAENCVKDAIKAIKKKDWVKLGEILNIAQGIHESFGVNTLQLNEIIFAIRKNQGIYGAKISGSGLGDCVIAIGSMDNHSSFNKSINNSVNNEILNYPIINDVSICDKGLELFCL